MTDDGDTRSKTENWLRSLKNHPLIAVTLIVAAIVTGLASFTESVSRLSAFFKRDQATSEAIQGSKANLDLERSLLGTWRPQSKIPTVSGFVVNDFYYTLLSGGVINWGGSYTYAGAEFPIMMSGNWRMEDGTLHYEVTSSNVPLVVKTGYRSATRIETLTETIVTYTDLSDGQIKTSVRID